MAYSLPAYTFELDLGLLTGAGTPSTDASSPISSYPSSPASYPSTQSREPHIPRPSNAFLIFRSEYVAIHKDFPQPEASKKAGVAWKKLPEQRKDYYKDLAMQRKEEHARGHPGYKYQPRRSKPGKKSNGHKKTDAPVAQISMDAQTFYRPPQNPMPSMPVELRLQSSPDLYSVDSSHNISTTSENGNGNGSFTGFATIQTTRPVRNVDHPMSPAASRSSTQLNLPQTEELMAFSIHDMDENEDLGRLLMRTYSLDSSYLDLIHDQLGETLYNEWGSVLDQGYPATNYPQLLPSLMASDAMGPIFPNSFGPF